MFFSENKKYIIDSTVDWLQQVFKFFIKKSLKKCLLLKCTSIIKKYNCFQDSFVSFIKFLNIEVYNLFV